ncbi:endopeptidase [Mycobacterium sherrisii]|uniref:Endopeptidase n=1 Tax=Mycobacterium sherrisii TaxID=243061 RepID=A0A1E3SS53_9MYCO|nr:endopeptidase [Mycobacterium sherrisii]ODR04980.1 endopeptidase [Mycobacterium sherrisii]
MERLYAQQLASFSVQPSRTGLLMLLLGAFASVAVAVLSFVLDRIKLHRVPGGAVLAARAAIPYTPAPRPRAHASKLTIAAAVVAAICIVAIWLMPKNIGYVSDPIPVPDPTPIALPAAGAAGPGSGIYVEYGDGSGGMGCTAGFLVHTSTGAAGILTAGHCNRPGTPSKVWMNLGGILPYATISTFVKTVSEGVHSEQHDIGLIVLSDHVPQSSAVAATLPITGVTGDLAIGQQLCKFGMSSGEAECGQILDVTESKVTFAAGGQCGDSGGPVYLMRGDGTATAVGIDIRGSNPASPNAGCLAPAKYSVAELVQPWLDRWQLTAVTAPPH